MLQPDPCGMTNPSDVSPPSPEVAPSSPSASAAKESPIPTPPPSEPTSPGLLQRLWTLVVRLLILGFSVSLGWIAGVLVAQVWPSRNPNPPIQERVMRQTSQTVRKVRQLPQWWQGANPSASDIDGPLPPAVDTQTAGPEEVPPSSPALNQEVAALQQELASLENRLAELEQQAGQTGTGSLADRLQQLAQASATSGETGTADNANNPEETETPEDTETSGSTETSEAAETSGDSSATSEDAPNATDPNDAASTEDGASAANDGLGRYAAAPYAEPIFPLVGERVVLPSALLFETGESLLTAEGRQLLDAVVPDLRRYGAVTFLVGSHTDGDLPAEEARQLTFQQALVIQTYLAAQMEETGSRWLSLGYGKTRPVAVGDAPGTEDRNQRIEIGIVRP